MEAVKIFHELLKTIRYLFNYGYALGKSIFTVKY
jgi:hypothetical protein